jgi:hypothetical protein
MNPTATVKTGHATSWGRRVSQKIWAQLPGSNAYTWPVRATRTSVRGEMS